MVFEKRPRMMPSHRFNRWLIKRLVCRNIEAGGVAIGKLTIGLHIQLLHPTKAPKLSFDAIKIAVVIGITCGEASLPPFVRDRDLFNAMYRER